MQPLGHLGLIVRRLRAHAVDAGAKLGEGPVVVAEGAVLRRAAARAGDRVPSLRQGYAGASGHRVEEQHAHWIGQGGEVDAAAARRGETQRRQRGAGQVRAAAVADGHREVGGQAGECSLGHVDLHIASGS